MEIQTPEGLKRMTVAEAETLLVHDEDWQPIAMSQGTKGHDSLPGPSYRCCIGAKMMDDIFY